MEDTIVAISTSVGEGAISIIRLSGHDALNIASKVFTKDLTKVDSHTIHYGFITSNNEKIDEVLNASDIYVQFQDKILGFETPPVIESGSTLVPMRFLFEQMGADVEWNQETQTATATLDNKAVTFSIDNVNASK